LIDHRLCPGSDFEGDHLGHDGDADAHPREPAEAGHDQAIIGEKAADILGVDPGDLRWSRLLGQFGG
jgi:hypothetical protein